MEESIDPEAFLNLPCKGNGCVLNKSDLTNNNKYINQCSLSSNRTAYTYKKFGSDGDCYDVYAITIKNNCDYTLNQSMHIIAGFYNKQCISKLKQSINFKKQNDFHIKNKPSLFKCDKFIKKSKSKPVISKKASDHIRVLRTHSNKNSWKIGVDYYDELTALPETTYKKVYQKRPTDSSIDKLLPQKNPEREFIMETLNTMKILSIGDTLTQEFLFKTFGRDVNERHWHKDTRIAILDTIAKIAKGESLPAYKKQKAEELLTSIDDSRGEDQDIINASMKALTEILTSDKETGGEMMLASDKATIVKKMEQNSLPNLEQNEENSAALQDTQEKLNDEALTIENVEHELINESNLSSEFMQTEQNIQNDNELEKVTYESYNQIEQKNISENNNIEPSIIEEPEKESLQKIDNDELPVENSIIDEKEHIGEKKTAIEADDTIETQVGLSKNEEIESPAIQQNNNQEPSQEASDLSETIYDAETEFDEEEDISLNSKKQIDNDHDIDNNISTNEKNITIEPHIVLTPPVSEQPKENKPVETENQSSPISNEQNTIENSCPQKRASRLGRFFKRKKEKH